MFLLYKQRKFSALIQAIKYIGNVFIFCISVAGQIVAPFVVTGWKLYTETVVREAWAFFGNQGTQLWAPP